MAGLGRARLAHPAAADAVPPSEDGLDRLLQPMPATTRLAEDPLILPALDGVAVRLPDSLKTGFKKAFPEAVWSRPHRLYLVTGTGAKSRVEAWLAKAARRPSTQGKAKPPPPLRLR